MSTQLMKRFARLALLTQAGAFILGGCFSPDTIFTAAANTLALTAAGSASSLLSGAVATFLGG